MKMNKYIYNMRLEQNEVHGKEARNSVVYHLAVAQPQHI